MKFHLLYNGGRYLGGSNGFEKPWDIAVEGTTLFAGQIRISIVSSFSDSVSVHLDEIPARIDLESVGNIWLQNESDVALHPEPYKTTKEYTGQVVWLKGEREKADIVEVGDLLPV